MTAAIVVEALKFGYRPDQLVLDIPHLEVKRGSTVFVHGPSGTGKTTLLGLLAGILTATAGGINILGQDLAKMSSMQRDAFRGAHIGFIFQMFNLLPYLSVQDNIQLACKTSRERQSKVRGKDLDLLTKELATELGIIDALYKPVTELSVGQQQRVAVARALLGSPEIIIADEPTSALDADRKEQFLKLLFSQADAIGATVLFVSHDLTLKHLFSDVISLPTINRARRT